MFRCFSDCAFIICLDVFLIVLFSLQVLDSLLAQYGTVENVEQGKDFKLYFLFG